MTKVLIAPSILSGDFAMLGESVACVEKWGADYVHVDVMDGTFVPNLTFGMPVVKAVRSYSKLPFDVHLMIMNPEKYVAQFVTSGADIVTFHPDSSSDIHGALDTIKSMGAKCGLALNPDKSLDLILPYIHKIDMVVLMGVYAGFGGQSYIAETDQKIMALKQIITERNLDIKIEVDGGINCDNASRVVACGADVLVAGNAVFGASDPAAAVQRIKG